MALQDQIAKLVDKLAELSEQGKVRWEETADENTFLASVAKFIVTIAKPNANEYSLTVADQSGKTLEEAREQEGSSYYVDYQRLAGLHELARRTALRVDEALSEMLSSLEQIH